MQEFLKWTLDTIRQDDSMMSWMEEKRFEWVPLTASMLKNLLEGQTIILISDSEREWFSKYTLRAINNKNKNRPLLSFVSLKTFSKSL